MAPLEPNDSYAIKAVYLSKEEGKRTVTWGKHHLPILKPDITLHSDPPYSFAAVDANKEETLFETFTSLLDFNGGTLTNMEKV